ncbi:MULTISPECIES: hypothetical protein [Acinetobacter]|uniref:hypothetical protein n=1 Tax=Acinetobacter TaxID=469 RepID=UPI0014445E3E|nr:MULTISPECIES: hypothetical protein [Acinetobacter]MBF4520783.1 hypothetical protein [Acinetobacter towneri]MDM1485904.1 hypothetical protein [Acinetobacter towneri]MEB6565849.1 hypothetical protein [Acinetobacter towneri]
MKLIKLISIASLVALAGCSSKVVTYDTAGQVIGSCVATQGFILGAKAVCYGGANLQGINYSKVDERTGLLPAVPTNTQISLQQD